MSKDARVSRIIHGLATYCGCHNHWRRLLADSVKRRFVVTTILFRPPLNPGTGLAPRVMVELQGHLYPRPWSLLKWISFEMLFGWRCPQSFSFVSDLIWTRWHYAVFRSKSSDFQRPAYLVTTSSALYEESTDEMTHIIRVICSFISILNCSHRRNLNLISSRVRKLTITIVY